jgi:hypothetical protein
MGRPPKAVADVKSRHLAVKVKSHEEALLRAVAEARGVGFSVWARTVLLLEAIDAAKRLGLGCDLDPRQLGTRDHPLP